MQAPIEFDGSLKPRPYTRRIVIHHSVSPGMTTVEQIHQWHRAKGWAGIGYHYVVRSDGTVWQGRPEDTQGAHAFDSSTRQANSDGIGICLCGNFEEGSPPTEAQLQALAELIKDIWTRYPGISVIGHRDVCATACPGRLFPWSDLNNRLSESSDDIIARAKVAGLIAGDHNPAEVADKRFVLQVGLNIKNGGKA